MQMRDGDTAVVDLAKLQLFCLDPKHPRGCHKARLFSSRLGLTAHDAEQLQQKLLKVVRMSDAAQPAARDDHGQRYLLDFEMTGPAGTANVRSSWIVKESGSGGPTFLTCWVL